MIDFNMNIKKIAILIVVLSLNSVYSYGQQYDADNTALAKFVTRMYNSKAFEGVRLVDDYDNQYLLSVVVLDPAKYGNNETTINRVASVKAMSEASRFFNGSRITMDLVITTKEDGQGNVTSDMLEKINEKSIGYVKALSLLTNFNRADGKNVFIYYKQIEPIK